MSLESDGAATAKRPRPSAEDPSSHCEAAEAADRISALPEAMQLHILSLLPLPSAIRTGALSRAWRDLWKRRWQDDGNAAAFLRHHLRPCSSPSSKKLLECLELRQSQGRRGRLDRCSLVADNPAMGARQFGRYLDAAARCGVEDLRVELPEKPPSPDTPTKATTLRFPFPAAAGPALARLSLRGIGVSGLHSRAARPCSALEVVRLHSVPVDDRGLARMLALCPRIRVLGLHSCSALRRIAVTAATGRKLSSVTIAGCSWLIEVDVAAVSSLRSFRYTGGFLSSFYLPDNAAFADLYICFDAQRSCNVRICQKVFSDWFESRVCSKLTALTICSNVLFVVSSLPNGISHAESAKVGGHFFQSMTELQLLMLDMKAPELANIYVFLKNSQCSNLERLFVQLPSIPSGPLVDSSNYVGVEPPEDVLENLKVVKITNFNWNRIEVQLVSFLLRKASSLHKLVLVTPSLVPLDVIGIQKEDLLLVGEAVANGKIILSKLDDAATKPFHSDVFAEV
ncbi:unnamed protein product [Triticum aestivum]|uniref:FBD domain-containing protein n=4 Tax=Triticinae TaxID=1648030 RepID=A0A9R1EXW9_WHEAT|nr:uncharacterized protein LOC123049985 [Triticum aestivum]KAF7018329.1 hypothetical protein CFC21_031627 [Triticum aestivum]SPT19887.1 unnamed protein product [Triticum aestivum]